MEAIRKAIRKAATHRTRRDVGRIALLIALGAMLAACDKCGNFSPLGSQAQIEVCREQPPQPK
jgi:hypothetical protein